ncbi:MAG: hypothetical protein KAT05_15795 [Spirochaetes bacterium]|nr:hypothetical protein [Spirochaetota bacterium]
MIIKVEPYPSDKELWGRSCKVKTDDGTFETPCRISTTVEFNSKAKIPIDLKIESPFSEAIYEYWHEDLMSLINKNGEFGKKLANLEAQSDIMAYSSLISYYPKLPKGTILDNNNMKVFLELQKNSPIQIASIPDFKVQTSYEKDLLTYCEYVKDGGHKEPMPILDLGLDHDVFKSRFDSICKNLVDEKTDTVHIIGFIYRNWKNYTPNFDYIFQNKDKEVLYHCLDVDRTYEISRLRREKAHTMHILQRWGFDTYSVKFQRGGGKKTEDENEKIKNKMKEQDLNKVLLFDRKTIGLFSTEEWEKKYKHNLNCDCEFCHNLSLDDFIEKYGYDVNGNKSRQRLNYASKLHEYYSSSLEFDESRAAIKEDDLKSYFNHKTFLKQAYGSHSYF